MWSGPRNLSTALMRSWENRPDTAVMDEPLYAHYLDQTKADHPGATEVIATGPAELEAAVQACVQPDFQGGETVSYQKQMAHHLLEGMDQDWIAGGVNMLLIRHPRRVIASYTRVRGQPTLEDLGLPQQLRLQQRLGPLPVYDADQFLADPETLLRSMCHSAGIDFDPAMLSWPAGERPSDGVWASHWYGSVNASTGFASAPVDDPEQIDLPPAMDQLARAAMGIYEELLTPP